MKEWLEEALEASSLSEDSRDSLMGRGATSEILSSWKIRNFQLPYDKCPDPALARRYGSRFDVFEGKILFPLYSARGHLLGFDSRSPEKKDEIRFLLPESQWHAVWIGMPSAMSRIWEGQDIVIVEGRFDVFAALHGVQNAAVLGSGPAHLSGKQVEFLRRWTVLIKKSEFHQAMVHLAYDIDATGQRGSYRSLKELRELGILCSKVRYGSMGDDPGVLWDRGGVESVRKVFDRF